MGYGLFGNPWTNADGSARDVSQSSFSGDWWKDVLSGFFTCNIKHRI